jgi:apolipoprotein N-acyltransferase
MTTKLPTRLFNRIANALKQPSYWLSFIAGLSLVFAYAPFSQWWLPFIVLPLWLNTLFEQQPKAAAKLGFIFGFGWFASGISWVHVAIDQFGGMPLFVSILLMLLLCLYLALFPALSCYLASRLTVQKKLSLWLIPATWLAGEYMRGVFLTGFPWLSLGYSQINSPLNALAPIIGEFGITSIILVMCVSITQIVKNKTDKPSLLALAFSLSAILISHQLTWTQPTGKSANVALIQGNIPQDIKWDQEQVWPTMLKYLDLSRVNFEADIIIWPESAVTSLEPAAQEFLAMANKSAALKNSAIVTGILNYNFESKEYFNSLVVLGKKELEDTEGSYFYGSKNRFDKHHLLPIGEFVPFQEWLKPIAPLFNLPNSSFSRGEYVQPNLTVNGYKLLPLICFEIAFPAQLNANFKTETDILLTVSNDSWFGDSHGPHQHLDIAKMRALEFGRPLMRSTNNGVTAVIDHMGKTVQSVPQFTETVLKADVQIVEGRTPYSVWGQYSQWGIAVFILFIHLGSVLIARNKNAN